VQLDGSFHAWLEERGPELCLMNMVDDATGTTLSQLHEQETIWAAVDVLRAWVEKYGVPRALYTDWKNVYVREATEAEMMAGKVPLTQFGRMCAKLGIRIIAANSPQAKGRVERSNGIQQDRLIKKLRLEQVKTAAEANGYLRRQYLPDHNQRFGRPAAEAQNYHLKAPSKRDLDAIFRMEEQRTISNDWVVRYGGRFFQIARQSGHAPAGAKVTVSEGRDGGLRILYRGRPARWEEIAAPVPPPKPKQMSAGQPVEVRRKLNRPAANHPWRTPLPLQRGNAAAARGSDSARAVGAPGKSKPRTFPPLPQRIVLNDSVGSFLTS
jgi:hypothetical protein